MQLSQLLGSTQNARVIGGGATDNVDICGLALDSRAVKPGYLFAALRGVAVDGRDFIPDALERGAAAVLTDSEGVDVGDAALVLDANPRQAFSHMVAALYDKQPATIAAVTGTNGKTSVASFTRQIWQALGQKAASIGTLGLEGLEGLEGVEGVEGAESNMASGLTTPDPISLHKALAEIAEAGVDHAVLEASSHGLAQYRIDGVRLSVAAFTNLTRDHLDYHQTTEDYLAAKSRLFGEVLAEDGIAVINTDSEFGPAVADVAADAGHPVIAVGQSSEATLRYSSLAPSTDGQTMTVSYEGREFDVRLPLFGRFQAENALLAAGIVIAAGGLPEEVLAALAKLEGAPGRFDLAGTTTSGARVFIDYAHTPDGLKNILGAGRTIAEGRVLVVFGCGGDRDAGKRPQMGAIAAELADRLYVTDDNPRSEDAAKIRREILGAAPGASEYDDRGSAIAAAVAEARAGDVVLVTGKGHEMGQDIGGEIIDYDDFSAVAEAIAAVDGKADGARAEGENSHAL